MRRAAWFMAAAALAGSARGQEVFRHLLIPANFPDAVSNIAREELDRFYNAESYARRGAARSVRDWVDEVSAGRTDLATTVVDWVTLPQPTDYYKQAGFSQGPYLLARDAVRSLEDRGFDFAPFDNDGDSVIEMVGVIYRGPASRFGTGDGPGWTQQPTLAPEEPVAGGRVKKTYIIWDYFPANDSMVDLGAVTHEGLYHAFGGLADVVGYNAGWWHSVGIDAPSHFSAYAKLLMGWVDVVDIESPAALAIAPVYSAPTVYRLWIDPWREHEFFLLEHRRPFGADAVLPGQGLLIWHIDELADQTRFERLEEADGLEELAVDTMGVGFGAANAGDPFPGSTGNTSFTPSSSPSSASNAGRATGIVIENIRLEAGVVRLDATPSAELRGFTLGYDETYPRFQALWAPAEGSAEGGHVAVRFTSAGAAWVRRVRFAIVIPGTYAYEVRLFGDFEPGMTIPEPPRYEGSGTAAGDFEWTTHEVTEPALIGAGESFVVDLVLAPAAPTVDYWGRAAGRSFFRAAGESAYRPVLYDFRLRVSLEPAAANAAHRWTARR